MNFLKLAHLSASLTKDAASCLVLEVPEGPVRHLDRIQHLESTPRGGWSVSEMFSMLEKAPEGPECGECKKCGCVPQRSRGQAIATRVTWPICQLLLASNPQVLFVHNIKKYFMYITILHK